MFYIVWPVNCHNNDIEILYMVTKNIQQVLMNKTVDRYLLFTIKSSLILSGEGLYVFHWL